MYLVPPSALRDHDDLIQSRLEVIIRSEKLVGFCIMASFCSVMQARFAEVSYIARMHTVCDTHHSNIIFYKPPFDKPWADDGIENLAPVGTLQRDERPSSMTSEHRVLTRRASPRPQL